MRNPQNPAKRTNSWTSLTPPAPAISLLSTPRSWRVYVSQPAFSSLIPPASASLHSNSISIISYA
ncbi:hypothetical protein HYC85_015758 [Camellia sinensis]|uniref:Uncharacterized protein n=1 Tax=Camellia sinensis TaxID=4442 RepID=A0A7J7GXY8_CAMSI|nr:hypothetical protein HYC85_015758 [Camellia sinensis]